jgi:hypothetical protein
MKNCESVLAGIAELHLFFPVLMLLNIGICMYYHIQLERVSVMWDQALQNGWHHHPSHSSDVLSVASTHAIKNDTV